MAADGVDGEEPGSVKSKGGGDGTGGRLEDSGLAVRVKSASANGRETGDDVRVSNCNVREAGDIGSSCGACGWRALRPERFMRVDGLRKGPKDPRLLQVSKSVLELGMGRSR